MPDDPEQPEWFNRLMRAQQTEKRASGSASAIGSAMRMQVLEANHWVDVHTRCHTEAGMKRIYKSFLKENSLPHKAAEPVCGMRIITVHFEHLGAFPRKAPGRRPRTREWLKKFDAVQRRTAKSKLQLAVKSPNGPDQRPGANT